MPLINGSAPSFGSENTGSPPDAVIVTLVGALSVPFRSFAITVIRCVPVSRSRPAASVPEKTPFVLSSIHVFSSIRYLTDAMPSSSCAMPRTNTLSPAAITAPAAGSKMRTFGLSASGLSAIVCEMTVTLPARSVAESSNFRDLSFEPLASNITPQYGLPGIKSMEPESLPSFHVSRSRASASEAEPETKNFPLCAAPFSG